MEIIQTRSSAKYPRSDESHPDSQQFVVSMETNSTQNNTETVIIRSRTMGSHDCIITVTSFL